MERQFHLRAIFLPFLGLFLVLNIINLNMLSQIQVRNFWQFLVFKKHLSWVLIMQRVRIFILEHFFIYSCKIWNVIYQSVQICKRIAQKFYPKLTIYLSNVFWWPLYKVKSYYTISYFTLKVDRKSTKLSWNVSARFMIFR